jgi:membrane-bound ClpP family serine protease
MKKKKVKNEPIDCVDRFLAAVVGVFVGGIISILSFAIFCGGLSAEGNLALGVLPGACLGTVLGLSFPRFFIMIGNGAFLGL